MDLRLRLKKCRIGSTGVTENNELSSGQLTFWSCYGLEDIHNDPRRIHMGTKHYPQEYRERLITLARSGRSVALLAEEFEPTPQTIRNWLDGAVQDVFSRRIVG